MKKILVINFGSQYSALIVKQLNKLHQNVEEIDALNINKIEVNDFSALILSGGPSSVNQININDWMFLKSWDKPMLGICFGMQLIAHIFNNKVQKGLSGQYGLERLDIVNPSLIFSEDTNNSNVWMSHFDEVAELSNEFTINAYANQTISGFCHKVKPIHALQFHPEVSHTTFGAQMIANFVNKVCALTSALKSENQINNIILKIKDEVKNDGVVLGLSGGVDSTVCAYLLQKAINEQLTCVLVDHGLMRQNEVNDIIKMFASTNIKIKVINYQEKMFQALKGVCDPETKRKIIGREFIKAFDEAILTMNNIKYLAQGTIFSDKIESAQDASKTHLIKSHHNVGGLPKEMNLKVIEPLKMFFKDEVRQIGLDLGIEPSFIWRHPFPGPGLSIRIIGEVATEKVAILQQADAILIAKLREHNLYETVAQAAVILTNCKSVGVSGDERTHNYVAALRIVESTNFMTANFARLDFDFLSEVSREITNNVSEINRVVYDITSKPPATIEWE